jgi:hypothetical protein
MTRLQEHTQERIDGAILIREYFGRGPLLASAYTAASRYSTCDDAKQLGRSAY